MKRKFTKVLVRMMCLVMVLSVTMSVGNVEIKAVEGDLLPLISGGQWDVHSKAKITGTDEVTHYVTDAWQNTYYTAPVSSGASYRLTVDNPNKGTVFVFEVDANGKQTWLYQSTDASIDTTFTTKGATEKILFAVSSGEVKSGTFVFKNPVLKAVDENDEDTSIKAPTNLKTSGVTENSVKLSWDPVSGVDKYEIKREGNVVYSGTDVFYVDNGLTPSTPYQYELRAIKGAKASEAVDVKVTTLDQDVPTDGGDNDGSQDNGASNTVNVEDFGAIPNDGKDDTAAFKKALEGDQNVSVGPGTFHVKDFLNVDTDKVRGAGEGATTILASQNAPIFKVTGQFNQISDMRLQYTGWENSQYTKRNAIEFTGNISMSTFENLHMVSVYRGFYIDDDKSKVSAAFSIQIRNIYVFGYEKNAIHLEPRIGGLSGSIIENIYTNNGSKDRSANTQNVVTFHFAQIAEMKLTQLNCEWANVESCFDIEYAREVVMDSIHIEGVDVYGDRLFRIGNDSHVNIRGLRAEDLRIRNNMHLFKLTGGAELTLDGFDEDRSKVYNGGFKVLSASGSGNTAYIKSYESSNFNTIGDKDKKNPDGSPILRQWNDDFIYVKQTKTF